MATTGLPVFDRTTHVTNEWLNDIAAELDTDDKHRAYSAMRAVLHAVRDFLPVDEVAQFGAEMPILVRGVYYEGWKPSTNPARERSKQDFLDSISVEMRDWVLEEDPEQDARAVFRVIQKKISAGEVLDVQHLLPEPVRNMWP